MRVITDPILRADPLWLALDRVVRAIHEDRRILFTKEPASDEGCNSKTINDLAAEACLANWPVFEVVDVMQGNLRTDRRLTVNHPDVEEPVKLVFWRLHGAPDASDAKIERIMAYLEAWRDKRATELRRVDVMSSQRKSPKRFKVALSFPGERREFISGVAECLAEQFGREHILYDANHVAEFARPNLDTYLQSLYHDESELICVFLCAEYEKKEWCGLEFRTIREMIKTRREADIMTFRFDTTKIAGLYSIDGYVWIADQEPAAIAKRILERLDANAVSIVTENPFFV